MILPSSCISNNYLWGGINFFFQFYIFRLSARAHLSYSYVSNKRRATFILFEEIFQALCSYSRPYVYLFLKRIIEKLGENRKKWLFSTTSFYSVTTIPGPPLVPDPSSFIRFWYFFQTLRLFATLRMLCPGRFILVEYVRWVVWTFFWLFDSVSFRFWRVF